MSFLRERSCNRFCNYLAGEGIDYSHPAFINGDGTSRILSIWDQTVENLQEGDVVPEGFAYGVEYSQEKINLALRSEEPLSVVPSKDTDGHGTFLAGVACGNRIEEKSFTGIAPLAGICVVKCKQAKKNLRDYYFINTENPCYAENDIMLGVRYLVLQARKLQMPLVVCIGMGTNQGGHNRGGILGELLQEYGDYRARLIVTAGGNEANAAHHYHNDALPEGGDVEVEIQVGEGEAGFTLDLWADVTDLYSVALISPDGEYSGKTQARLGERREIHFLFESTVVYIEYLLTSYEGGAECIRLRFRSPAAGVWRVRVFNENAYSTSFDMWLPIQNFIGSDTYFLRPDPNMTLCDPSNNIGIITCAYYDSSNRSTVIESGRGYTRDGSIKPDIASSGVNIYGPLPFLGNYPINSEERQEYARYGYRSGSSESAAVTAGSVALLAEWALLRGNDLALDSTRAKQYLIRGANREDISTPNRLWGNGTLDLYGVFDSFRPRL